MKLGDLSRVRALSDARSSNINFRIRIGNLLARGETLNVANVITRALSPAEQNDRALIAAIDVWLTASTNAYEEKLRELGVEVE